MIENKTIELKKRAAALVEAKRKELDKEALLSAQPSSDLNASSWRNLSDSQTLRLNMFSLL